MQLLKQAWMLAGVISCEAKGPEGDRHPMMTNKFALGAQVIVVSQTERGIWVNNTSERKWDAGWRPRGAILYTETMQDAGSSRARARVKEIRQTLFDMGLIDQAPKGFDYPTWRKPQDDLKVAP